LRGVRAAWPGVGSEGASEGASEGVLGTKEGALA